MNDFTNIAAALATGLLISALVLVGLAVGLPLIEYPMQWWVRWPS